MSTSKENPVSPLVAKLLKSYKGYPGPWYRLHIKSTDCWEIGTSPVRGDGKYVHLFHGHPADFNHPGRKLYPGNHEKRKASIVLAQHAFDMFEALLGIKDSQEVLEKIQGELDDK